MFYINYDEFLGFFFYYLIFCSILFFVILKFVNWINSKQLFILVGTILLVVAAFRGIGIDKDYTTYQYSFSLVSTPIQYFINYSDWTNFEPFYYIIPSILKFFSFPFYEQSLFFIFAFVAIMTKFFGIYKLSRIDGLSLLIYFSFFFFLHEMTQIRVGIAAGGLLVAAYFYYNNKYLLFFLVLILATCFQYTGILIGLVLLLNKYRFNIIINLSLLIASFLCILLKVNVISEFLFVVKLPFTDKLMLTLKTLTKKENELNAFNIPLIINFFITVWLFFNHKKIIIQNQYGYLLLKIQLISFICFGLFSSIAVIAFRLYEFFGVVSIITTTFLVYTTRYKLIGYLGVCLYCLLLMVNLLHITKLVAPYKFIFFQD
jgi:hypothetical protein